jgi:hypothetical protein
MGSRLALATQDWEGHLAGDGECLNQNEGARPPRDRTGDAHMDLFGGKYKVRRSPRAKGGSQQALVRDRMVDSRKSAREPCFVSSLPAC